MIIIDPEKGVVRTVTNGKEESFSISSSEAFSIVSKAWLRCGWDTKYVYGFTWLGRPIIQLPDDMLRIQEVIYSLKPSVIIETGIAHGGSLVYYASLCKLIGRGKVIGVDVEIRPHNRTAIETHELFPYITLIEGSSVELAVVNRVKEMVGSQDTVLVVLDSNHTKDHVLRELECYAPLVTKNSYAVASDGIMKDLAGAPRSNSDWQTNNPYCAAQEFAAKHKDFVIEQPTWRFNESNGLSENVTYWPGAWLKKIT
jgi:cephalosporin hydroxylase